MVCFGVWQMVFIRKDALSEFSVAVCARNEQPHLKIDLMNEHFESIQS